LPGLGDSLLLLAELSPGLIYLRIDALAPGIDLLHLGLVGRQPGTGIRVLASTGLQVTLAILALLFQAFQCILGFE